jgi:hypothetical protein
MGPARGDVLHFLLLHDVSGSKETDDKLVPGKYACRSFSRGQMSYEFMDVAVTGPTTYGGGRQRSFGFIWIPIRGRLRSKAAPSPVSRRSSPTGSVSISAPPVALWNDRTEIKKAGRMALLFEF